jgi:phage gpG-like protein
VDSGRLKRSIRIVAVTPTSVTIGTDVPYAQIHNDGFNGSQSVRAHTQRVKEHQRKQKVKGKKGKWKTKKVTVKAHTRNIKAHTRNMKMPRRRFLGSSAELEKQIMELIMSEINAAISNL